MAVAGYYEILLLEADTGQLRSRLVGISPRINTVHSRPMELDLPQSVERLVFKANFRFGRWKKKHFPCRES